MKSKHNPRTRRIEKPHWRPYVGRAIGRAALAAVILRLLAHQQPGTLEDAR